MVNVVRQLLKKYFYIQGVGQRQQLDLACDGPPVRRILFTLRLRHRASDVLVTPDAVGLDQRHLNLCHLVGAQHLLFRDFNLEE